MELAAQFYTLRDFTTTVDGFDHALEKVRAIGYRSVQLSAVACLWGENPTLSVEGARKLLDKHDLRCIATHRPVGKLFGSASDSIAEHQVLGCSYTAPGAIVSEYGREAHSYRRFIEDYLAVESRYVEAGITVGYHNHSWEFAVQEGTHTPNYSILIEEGPASLHLELDTYWVAHAGADPAAWIRKCAGRASLLHVKDMEVILDGGQVMAPVGEGNLNWDAIVEAARAAGTSGLIVEQDVCRRDPFDCLRSSYEFLKARYGLV